MYLCMHMYKYYRYRVLLVSVKPICSQTFGNPGPIVEDTCSRCLPRTEKLNPIPHGWEAGFLPPQLDSHLYVYIVYLCITFLLMQQQMPTIRKEEEDMRWVVRKIDWIIISYITVSPFHSYLLTDMIYIIKHKIRTRISINRSYLLPFLTRQRLKGYYVF